MRKLLLILLIALLATGSAQANDPKKTYSEQKKYRFVFCDLAIVPARWCHRIKRPK